MEIRNHKKRLPDKIPTAFFLFGEDENRREIIFPGLV